jgi:hypothetical protein
MKWRRWAFVTLCLLTLLGLYSARRSIISWTLSSRFATRIDSNSLETSFQNNSFEMHEASVTLGNGQLITAERAFAQVDLRTIWSGDLVIDQLQLDRVSIPARIPSSTRLILPAVPDEFSSIPDLQTWAEAWISDTVGLIDRDAPRVLWSAQELKTRADQLQATLDQAIKTDSANIHQRRQSALIAQEYHAIKQRLAELRIQARTGNKDLTKRWAQVPQAMSEKFRSRALSMIPDANRQIQELATAYSQRVTPTVLAYCDIVAGAMSPRQSASTKTKTTSTTLIRKASLSGVLVDPKASGLQVPFECQSCQWAWDTPSNLPTTSIWIFEVPDGQGALEIQAEQRVGQGSSRHEPNPLVMNCYWYASKDNQPFKANPSRIHIEVQQTREDRNVCITAPWANTHNASEELGSRLSPLSMTFRQSASPSRFAKSRSIPVAWESVTVQPRTLFEIEAAFDQRKQKWLQETQKQWEAISSGLIAAKERQSIELWDNQSVQCIQTLQGIEKQLVDWQQKWDASTPHPQYRVGNRLANHPDAYALPLGRVDGKRENRIK